MSERTAKEREFKAPDGPAPKKRKLVEVEDGMMPGFACQDDLNSSCPLSPSSLSDRSESGLYRSNSSLSNSDRAEGSENGPDGIITPILTPTESPRHSCPSSPCESHHSLHNVHHAKLQVLRASSPASTASSNGQRRVGLVFFAKEQLALIDALPRTPGRCAAIQNTLDAYGLLDKAEIIVPALASAKDLMAFHSEDYVEAIHKSSFDLPISDTESVEMSEDQEVYGLKDDCAPFPNLWPYVRLTAGATILAARFLIECDRGSLVTSSPTASPRPYPSPTQHPPINTRNNAVTSSSTLVNPLLAIPKPEKVDRVSPSTSRSPSPSPPAPTSSNSSTNASSTSSSISTPIATTTEHSPKPANENAEHLPLRPANRTTPTLHQSQPSLPPVAIHWMGGRHHAKREEANGLCFVNDAVLALLQLANHFERVLYVDIDIHHGDGVEEAFKFSKQVLTLSIHLHEPGFYPGSGSIDEIGDGRAKYYTVNVPFREGVVDDQYTNIFDSVVAEAVAVFDPKAIVLVAGADCLAGDPLGGFNLTLHGVEHCIKALLALQLPLLVLGGGGYHIPNVARLAAIVTAACMDITLPERIPAQASVFVDPSTFYTPEVRKVNRNTEDYLKMLEATVLDNIRQAVPDE